VAIINEAMVKEFFPKRNPIGVHFGMGSGDDVKLNIEIVGVVKDTKESHVRMRIGRISIDRIRSLESFSG